MAESPTPIKQPPLSGLTIKIIMVAALAILLTGASVGLGVYTNSSRIVDQYVHAGSQSVLREQFAFQSSMTELRRDLNFLASLPALTGFEAEDGADNDAPHAQFDVQSQPQLTQIFRRFLETKPSYLQVRLISARDGGRELVRVERSHENGPVRIQPHKLLQRKANRPYFKETVRLHPGQIYFSEINLNREFGQIALPHQPVLRGGIPIFADTGKVEGIVVINVGMAETLERLGQSSLGRGKVYVTNSNGDFLYHSNKSLRFAFEYGQKIRIQDRFPSLNTFVRQNALDVFGIGGSDSATLQQENNFLEAWRIRYDPEQPQSHLNVIHATTKKEAFAALYELRNAAFAITAALTSLGIALAIVVALLLTRPLNLIIGAVTGFGDGEISPMLPTKRRDEIGALARALRRMMTTIKEHERELTRERDRARQASRAKDSFLANMSHEIRTPLNGIIGTAHLIRKTDLDTKQQGYVATMKESGENLLVLLNDILDISRIEAGKFKTTATPFPLFELFDRVYNLHHAQAAHKNLDLTIDLDKQLPAYVCGDRNRIRQVTSNLVANAIKFTEHGTVAVSVTANPRDKNNVTLICRVADTGIGIPTDQHGIVFQEFMQANTNTLHADGGSGLGLAICKSLVESMGGRIDFCSSPGEGSTFWYTLTLPIVSETDYAATVPTPNETRADGSFSGRVLVVEDIEVNRFIITDMLERMGCSVVQASNGAEACDMVLSTSFDLVLMDMRMPVMDGLAATRKIRASDPTTPIVALTANASETDRHNCLAAGMNDFAAKPVDPIALQTILRKHLTAGSPRSKPCAPETPIASGAPTNAVDTAFLDGLKENAPDKAQKFAALTLANMDEFFAGIEASMADDDLESLAEHAHALKSVAAQAGAEALSAMAKEMEHAGKTQDSATARKVYASFPDAYDAVKDVLQKYAA